MGLYSQMTDQELADKISKYMAAIEEAELGGGVGVVAGEGRRMEFTSANLDAAKRTLDALVLERDRRGNNGRIPGRAIGMRFYP